MRFQLVLSFPSLPDFSLREKKIRFVRERNQNVLKTKGTGGKVDCSNNAVGGHGKAGDSQVRKVGIVVQDTDGGQNWAGEGGWGQVHVSTN